MARKKNTPKQPSSPEGNFPLAKRSDGEQSGMRIIALRTLREFWEKHENAEQALKAWYQEATDSRWNEPNDIKVRYPSADIIPGNRIVFNIKGNLYRLIVKIHYNTGIIFIRFVGTHAEYDKVDAADI
jgi:mRNA interferase HigB